MYESEHDEAYWEARNEELANEIEHEDNLWKQAGFHPGMIVINAQLMQFKVAALVEMVKRLGVTEAEMNAVFRECMLKQLRQDRAMLTEEKMKAGRPDMLVAKKNLLGPDGKPMSL